MPKAVQKAVQASDQTREGTTQVADLGRIEEERLNSIQIIGIRAMILLDIHHAILLAFNRDSR